MLDRAATQRAVTDVLNTLSPPATAPQPSGATEKLLYLFHGPRPPRVRPLRVWPASNLARREFGSLVAPGGQKRDEGGWEGLRSQAGGLEAEAGPAHPPLSQRRPHCYAMIQ
jgi:hypothetical protein